MAKDIFQGYRGAALKVLMRYHVRVWGQADIHTTRGLFKGTVLPRSESDDDRHIVLKIESGYNIGIDVDTIQEMKETGFQKANYKIPEKAFPYSDDKPNVKLFGRRNHRFTPGLSHRCCNSGIFTRRIIRSCARTGRHL